MATRFVMDASGIRASKPGWDAYGSPAGLVLNIGQKAGRILSHSAIALRYRTYTERDGGTAPGSNQIADAIGTIYFTQRSVVPDVVIYPHNGVTKIPWIEEGYNRYIFNLKIYSNRAEVAISNRTPTNNDTSTSGLPGYAIYIIYAKPLIGT